MPRILSALCVLLTAASAFRVSAQVYPYRDGTPGVIGYRSEVIARGTVDPNKSFHLRPEAIRR